VAQVPLAHVPHEPPQPSDPQTLPSQSGTQTHWPLVLQVGRSDGQPLPQTPPQPSGPHCLPSHWGRHSHWPLALQKGSALGHVPQPSALQPLEPHSFPLQAFVAGVQPSQRSPSWLQVPLGHVPHDPPQPSSPQMRSPQSGWHSHL